eukprot:3379824-Rhodomonas_salina.2
MGKAVVFVLWLSLSFLCVGEAFVIASPRLILRQSSIGQRTIAPGVVNSRRSAAGRSQRPTAGTQGETARMALKTTAEGSGIVSITVQHFQDSTCDTDMGSVATRSADIAAQHGQASVFTIADGIVQHLLANHLFAGKFPIRLHSPCATSHTDVVCAARRKVQGDCRRRGILPPSTDHYPTDSRWDVGCGFYYPRTVILWIHNAVSGTNVGVAAARTQKSTSYSALTLSKTSLYQQRYPVGLGALCKARF